MEVLQTNAFALPTRANLNAWINTYGLNVTTVMDAPGHGTASLDTYGIRESCFVVDLTTMRIVHRYNGSIAGVGASGVSQALTEFRALLAGPDR